jgi:Tol biopolymer transport system component
MRSVAAVAIIASGVAAPAWAQAAPELIGRGVVSSALPEFATSVSPDGNEFWFNRAAPDRSNFAIMLSRRAGGQWSEPVVAAFSGTWRDADPALAPDGKRLYFSSERPRTASAIRSWSTWYVERTATGWSEPIDPGPPLNSDSTDIFVSVTRAGEVVFSSDRQGPRRIFIASAAGRGFAVPRLLEPSFPDGPGNPAISPGGTLLIVTQSVEGRAVDLFYSCRTATGWTTPVALPEPVNSRYADFAPAIDAAEQVLYFTSERPGIVGAQPDSVRPPGDLYQVKLRDAGVACR